MQIAAKIPFRRVIWLVSSSIPKRRLFTVGAASGSDAAAEIEARAIAAVREENRLDTEWVRSYPKLGKQPQLWSASSSSAFLPSPRTMDEYVLSRGYAGTEDLSSRRLLTTMLTYPLSLSYGIRNIYGDRLDSLNITVLGARKESSLPNSWWSETMRTCDMKHLNVSMVGPGLQKSSNPEHVIRLTTGGYDKVFTKSYTNTDICSLHDHPDAMKILRNTHMFVLFNPGLGSKPLKESWRPTLDLLLMTKKPILCTSHCQMDMERDLDWMKEVSEEDCDSGQGEQLEYLLNPTVNPFRSMQRDIDINEVPGAQILNCNYGIYAVQAK